MRFWGILSLATLAVAAPAAQGTVQAQEADINSNSGRAAAIIEAFRHSWTGYKTYAWGYDELLSVSNKGGNSRFVTHHQTIGQDELCLEGSQIDG